MFTIVVAYIMARPFNPSIYFVADPSLCGGRDIVDVVVAALRGGITMVQYRNKSGDMKKIYAEAAELAELLKFVPSPPSLCPSPLSPHVGRGGRDVEAWYGEAGPSRSWEGGEGIPFIVNDYIDVAFAVGAAGVHLGQGDASPEEAREKLGAEAIIGQTAFTEEQIRSVNPEYVDYIGLGPFYITKTRKGKPLLGEGNGKRFRELAALSPVPVVGIGGITPGNAKAVLEAGADGVAMMRSISEVPDVEAAARAFVWVL